MLAMYAGAAVALVSLLFVSRDDKLVRELKHKRSLEESQRNNLKEHRRKESAKYTSEEGGPPLPPTFSQKLLQTVSEDKQVEGMLSAVIEYFNDATSAAAMKQNPLTRWMKWIKLSLTALLVLIGVGLAAWLYSLFGTKKTDDIVLMAWDGIVTIFPKLNGTDTGL